MAGVGPAGHAVNPACGPAQPLAAGRFGRLKQCFANKAPSPMGLDGAIHGANGPAGPTTPPPTDFRDLRPCVNVLGKYAGRHPGNVRNQALKSAATGFCLCFFFCLRGWPRRNLSVAGRVARRREPHGCGDRAYMDVLAASPAQPTRPANPRNPLFAESPSHEGLRRWPPTARAPPPDSEPCACSRIDHAIDDNVVPTWCRTLPGLPGALRPAPPSPSPAMPGPASRAAPSGPARP